MMLIKANQWVTVSFQAMWTQDVEVNTDTDVLKALCRLMPHFDVATVKPEHGAPFTMTGLDSSEEVK